jgi:hypothetical protein
MYGISNVGERVAVSGQPSAFANQANVHALRRRITISSQLAGNAQPLFA